MSLSGKIRMFVGTDPGTNPAAGKVYVWIEEISSEIVWRYRDENGVVENIGSAGASTAV